MKDNNSLPSPKSDETIYGDRSPSLTSTDVAHAIARTTYTLARAGKLPIWKVYQARQVAKKIWTRWRGRLVVLCLSHDEYMGFTIPRDMLSNYSLSITID